jgi:hypothetical protein
MTVTIGRRELLAALGGAVVTSHYLLRAAEAVAPSLGIELVSGRVENAADDIGRAVEADPA